MTTDVAVTCRSDCEKTRYSRETVRCMGQKRLIMPEIVLCRCVPQPMTKYWYSMYHIKPQWMITRALLSIGRALLSL